MTSSIKQVYTYTSVKDLIFQIVKKSYGYDVDISLGYLDEYDMEGERPTIIVIQKMDPNTRDTDHTSMGMLYQAEITYYIKRCI